MLPSLQGHPWFTRVKKAIDDMVAQRVDASSVITVGGATGNAAHRYAFFIFLLILQILNSTVEAMDSNQGMMGSQHGDQTEAAANPYLPSRDGAPVLDSCLGDGDYTDSDFQQYSSVLDRSQSPFQEGGGTTQGSTGDGGGAVGPSGLAPRQTSGVTPDLTSGQRGLGSCGFLATSLAVA